MNLIFECRRKHTISIKVDGPFKITNGEKARDRHQGKSEQFFEINFYE